ncbi:MAG: ureidoglycolate lyase [Myxococcaceae bacterium]|nr:ureidoglycolate lyase [Myxococcaceae bacterium]
MDRLPTSAAIINVPTLHATRENIAEYGVFIGTDVPNSGLPIPFYKGAVEEGHNLAFQYHEQAVVRTARIHPRPPEITWLERHLRMTQLFIGLGDAPLALVLGKPNHQRGASAPDLEDVRTFILPPGHGVMIHLGTWHDFPMALQRPVTVFTANSAEVVEALASQQGAEEMDRGDVFKIDIRQRTGKILRVSL